MKQIETGCLAVVIGAHNPFNNGKVVTVGKYLGTVEGFAGLNHWGVSVMMVSTFGDCAYHIPQALLLRIDGDEFLEFDESIEELENSNS